MTRDPHEFWNEMWAGHNDLTGDADDLLVAEVEGLKPGRALDIGCGAGGNAVWLAEHGWEVTATDFADAAIEKGTRLAIKRGVHVKFVVAEATTFRPDGQYDLITSFYIHLPPDQRAKMLSLAAGALTPGGTLLFVGHDKSSPPSGWAHEDMVSLTTPDEVASELTGLKVERAYVVEHGRGEHAAHSDEPGDDHHTCQHSSGEGRGSLGSGTTVVRAVSPAH